MIGSSSIQIILIAGAKQAPTGITVTLTASATTRQTGERIVYIPPDGFTQAVKAQVEQVILPQVDIITRQLGLRRRNFTLEIENLGLSTIVNQRYQLTGFSADLPIFLALLSSACRIEIPSSTAATGHVSGSTGSVAMISNLPEKILACRNNSAIKHLIIPSLEASPSLGSLAPEIQRQYNTAIKMGRGALKISEVEHLSDAIGSTWTDDAIVLGALKTGFFERQRTFKIPSPVYEKITHSCTESTFWSSLKWALTQNRPTEAQELLQAYIEFHHRRKRFPMSITAELDLMLQSIPKITLQKVLSTPLISKPALEKLKHLAGQGSDLNILNRLATPVSLGTVEFRPSEDTIDPMTEAHANLDYLIEVLTEPRLSARTSRKIDAARANFPLYSSTVSSDQEVSEVLTTFYIHVEHQLGNLARTPSRGSALANIIQIVNQAFPTGGLEKAENCAIKGIGGGIGAVLDQVAIAWREQLKKDYIDFQINLAVDPTDTEERCSLLRALAIRYPQYVPYECRFRPVDDYLDRIKEILVSLFQNINRTRSTIQNH